MGRSPQSNTGEKGDNHAVPFVLAKLVTHRAILAVSSSAGGPGAACAPEFTLNLQGHIQREGAHVKDLQTWGLQYEQLQKQYRRWTDPPSAAPRESSMPNKIVAAVSTGREATAATATSAPPQQ